MNTAAETAMASAPAGHSSRAPVTPSVVRFEAMSILEARMLRPISSS